jgi:hypothetical protein
MAMPATPPAAGPEPYGTNDAGGFRNVLPPGEAGADNALQLAAFQAAGTLPPHWADQQPLYDGLITADPRAGSDVGDFYKDATFGVPAGQSLETSHPAPG